MAPSKADKKGLTLEKLTSYDDVITDAIVDKVGRYIARAQKRTRFQSE
jgi:histone-lysine N-methyltransferase SUV420H